jgi:hypothetical protein
MRPAARRALVVLAALVGLVLALLLALPYVLSLDAMRARILASAESTLHRKVDAGRIRLQILGGVGAGLDGLVVHNGPGWESPALLTARRVSIKLAFWPLPSRRIEVRRVVLDAPALTVERSPAGALNVDDLMRPAPAGPAPGSPPAAAALLMSRLDVAGGSLRFVDRKVAPGRSVATSLDDLHGTISDVGAATAARFDLAGRFLAAAGSNLSLSGTFGPPAPGRAIGEAPLAAELQARGLELARLGPYLGASSDPGVFTVDARADGAPLGRLHVAGTFGLAPHGQASTMPPVDGRFDAALDWPAGTLVLARSPLSVAKLPLTLEGRFEGVRGEEGMRTSLRLRTEGDAPVDAVTGIAGMGAALPADVRLTGRVRLDATVQGPSSALETRGAIDAAPFGVTRGGKPMLAAPAIRATLARSGAAPLAGRVTAATGTLQGLAFEDLVADWTWNDGAVTLAPKLRALGGTLAARIQADLRAKSAQAPAHASFEVDRLDGRRLVDSMTSVRDVLAGTLTARLDLDSRGLSWDAVQKTARGDGHLTVADAELKTVQLMPKVAETLSAVGRVAGFAVPPGLQSTKFSRLDTSLRLADGRLGTPDLVMTGRDASVAADGSVGLDRTLSYQGRITLAPSLVKTLGNVGRYVADEEGKLTLPFHVAGAVTAPAVTIDQSVVAELGRRALAREAGARVGGTAGKILGDAVSGDGKGNDPLGGILGQFLAKPAPTPSPKPH